MSENTLAVVLSLKYRTCPKVARDSEIGCFCTSNIPVVGGTRIEILP